MRSTDRKPRALICAPPPERPFAEEVGRDPGRLRIAFTDKSPYGEAIDSEIAAAVREVATLLAGLGHDVEERAPDLAADPAVVMATIVGANTALNVRLAEARFGRAMTASDFELLTLASAHNAQNTTATDYVAAQLAAFQISRGLATFFETCDVLLCPTLCSPPLRIGELNSMSQDLSHIAPILRRYMPGDLDVQHVGPARHVGAAGMERGRIAARHDVRRPLRRRGDIIPPGGPTRTRAPLEEQSAASLRIGRQNSAAFASKEAVAASVVEAPVGDGVIAGG